MADLFGKNATKRDVNIPSEMIPPGEYNGKIKVAYDEFEYSAQPDTGDIISMMKLPQGSRVLEAVLKTAAMGTDGELNVGTAADPDRLIDGADTAAASVDKATDAHLAGLFEKLEDETQIVVEVENNGANASGKIQLAVFFV